MTRRPGARIALVGVLAVALALTTTGCSTPEDDHSLPTDPNSAYGLPTLLGLEPIIRDKTLPLAEDAISQLSVLNPDACAPTNADRVPCNYQILFSTVPADLVVDSVLVSTVTPVLPAGLLVRVTGIQGPWVTAVEATLSDAIEQGEFRVEKEFGAADAASETLVDGVTSTARVLGAGGGVAAPGLSLEDPGLDFNYAIDHVQLAEGVFVDGGVSFSVGCGAYAGLTWKKKWGVPLYPNGAYFQASCGVTQDGALQISGTKGGKFDQTAHIATVTLDTIVTWVGPVPIVLIPKVSIDVSADGELAAGVSFGVSEHFGANIGIKYTDDFHVIKDFSRNLSSQSTVSDQRVSANGDVTVGESLLLYGVAGPTMSETLYLNLKATAKGEKPLWCLRGGLRASVGLSVDLGITDLEWGPESVYDKDAELTCAGNSTPTIKITNPFDGASVFPGTSIAIAIPTFSATAVDPEEGPLAVTWSSDRDGVLGTTDPSKKLKVSDLSIGEHVITATATDSDGATATATIHVEASVATPSLSFQMKDDYGNWNAISTISGSVGDIVYVRVVTSHTLVIAVPNCNGVVWQSTLTVTTSGTCDYPIELTQEGSFTVKGTVTDQDGRKGSATLFASVAPAPSVVTPQLSSITATRTSPNPQFAIADGGTLSANNVVSLQASYLNSGQAGVAVRYEWTIATNGGSPVALNGSDPQPDSGSARQFTAPNQFKIHNVYVFRVYMINQATNAVIQTRTFTLEYQGEPA